MTLGSSVSKDRYVFPGQRISYYGNWADSWVALTAVMGAIYGVQGQPRGPWKELSSVWRFATGVARGSASRMGH